MPVVTILGVPVSEEVASLGVAFFYNTIRNLAERFIGKIGNIPVDVVLLVIGYLYRHTWWGKGLLYGAATSLGEQLGEEIAEFFRR